MDTSDPEIEFDSSGVCNHALKAIEYFKDKNQEVYEKETSLMLEYIKKQRKGKKYDCIIGLSGGVDSSYVTYLAKEKFQLNPLIVHVDAGWNNDIAVKNIKNLVQKLNLDLHTIVIDWEKIRSLQLAYFKSSIANIDVPQDHVFISSVYKLARKKRIPIILNGNNMSTESILPQSWGYDAMDSTQIKHINRIFNGKKLKGYPMMTPLQWHFIYPKVLKIRSFSPLNMMDYNKSEAMKILKDKFDWQDYGGKHNESKFTRFFQSHYLPKKFNIDKRKAHLSSLIISNQITRDEALIELKKPLYEKENDLKSDIEFFIKKLGITIDEYEEIMNLPVKNYTDYRNSELKIARYKKIYRFMKRTFKI